MDLEVPRSIRGGGTNNIKRMKTKPREEVTPKPGGARRIAVGTAMALTDYPWSLARLAAAEIADGAR